MTFLKWIAAAALIGSATACIDNNTPSGGGYSNGYAYSPGAYDYNQQPTYYGTHYADGQPTYGSRLTMATDISRSRSTTAIGSRLITVASLRRLTVGQVPAARSTGLAPSAART
jgi:hypothetical protein